MSVLVDYHIHSLAHGGWQFTTDRLRRFIHTASENGILEIGITEHDEYLDQINPEVWAEVLELSAPVKLLLGLEVSYHEGIESEIEEFAKRLHFDYLIGSVHELKGFPFDHPDYVDRYADLDIDKLYLEYFQELTLAVRSGFFRVVGHLDLAKVFGYRPSRPVLDMALETLTAIREAGMVVEVNTAGLFKPVGEIYPDVELLSACKSFGIPITFGSDAHNWDQVGREFERAEQLARRAGYSSYARLRPDGLEMLSL